VLKKQLSPEECFRAVDECGAPMVSIPGGEPLMHPQIAEIVKGLVARKKYIYLCTNALLLKEKLHEFTPSKYLTFSVHMDGQREEHDFSVCREGTYEKAVEAIQLALQKGFRVTTNTTLFDGADPKSVRQFFDDMMELGVEGMMLSPGYTYDKAPDQDHFLSKKKTKALFRQILSNRHDKWRFNLSPLFMEMLMGKRDYKCTPWGMPTYNIFGWQKPICCRTATPTHSKNCCAKRIGISTAPRAVIRNARTAWYTAATKRARWTICSEPSADS
jgi:hopanoid biosynthesis associated radical SAM protein HpnH